MNANELIKELEFTAMPCLQEAVTTIRQQQAEIEALKMEIHSLTYGERLAEYLRKAQE